MHLLVLLLALVGMTHSLIYENDLDDWIETDNTGKLSTGTWSHPQNCPGGSFVNGYGVQTNPEGELLSISLQCSQPNETSSLIPTQQIHIGSPGGPRRVDYMATNYAIGFAMQHWTEEDGQKFIGGRVLRFKDQDIAATFPPGTHSIQMNQVFCHDGWAICGIQGRISRKSGAAILTRLRFRCCYFCIPYETQVILRDYTNEGSTESTFQLTKSVGVRVETSQSYGGHRQSSNDFTTESSRGTTLQVNDGSTATDTTNVIVGSSVNENSAWDLRLGSSNSSTTGSSRESGVRASTSLGRTLENSKSDTKTRSDSTAHGSSNSQNKAETSSSTSGNSKRNCHTKSTSQSETNSEDTSNSVHASVTADVRAEAGFSGFGVKASVSAGLSTTVGGSSTTNQGHSQTSNSGTEDQDCSESSDSKSKGTEVSVRQDKSVNVQWGTEDQQMARQSQSVALNSDRSVDTRNQVTTGRATDVTKNVGLSKGMTTTKDKSLNQGTILAVERAVQNGAQSMFLARNSGSLGSGTNWNQMSSSMWHEETSKMDTFICEAMHRCILHQVVGHCGVLTVRTEKFNKTIERLEPKVNMTPIVEKKVDPWAVEHPGETWIVTQNISVHEATGIWGAYERCRPGTVVTGYQFKTKFRFGLTGVHLICTDIFSKRDGKSIDSSGIESQAGSKGTWRNPIVGKGNTSFALGYSFGKLERNGTYWTGNQQLIFNDEEPLRLPSWATNSSLVQVQCPPNHAICGLKTMMDKVGRGLVTFLAFKCCHHCIPREEYVTRASIQNASPTPISNRVRVLIGTDRSSNEQSSQSSHSGSSADSAGVNLSGLQAGFAARFGSTSSSGYDWSRTSSAMFNSVNETELTYDCEPWMLCEYQQLVGVCGVVETSTSYAIKSSVPLIDTAALEAEEEAAKNTIKLTDHDTPFEVILNGQLWMNLVVATLNSSHGTWGRHQSCADGSFVTSIKTQHHPDTGLTALALECSQQDTTGGYVPTKLFTFGIEGVKNTQWVVNKLPSKTTPAVGVYFLEYEYEDGTQDTDPVSLIYTEEDEDHTQFDWPEDAKWVTEVKATCPPQYRICGVQAKMDTESGIGLDGISDLKLRCCYWCEPTESWVELTSVDNTGPTPKVHNVKGYIVGTKQHSVSTIKQALEKKNLEISGLNFDPRRKGTLRKMFTNRFNSNSQFNWRRAPRDLWSKEEKHDKSFDCQPKHHCRFLQLVGECGDFEVATASFRHRDTPLTSQNDLDYDDNSKENHA